MSTDPIDLDAIERMAAGSHDPVMALQARALVAEVRRLRGDLVVLGADRDILDQKDSAHEGELGDLRAKLSAAETERDRLLGEDAAYGRKVAAAVLRRAGRHLAARWPIAAAKLGDMARQIAAGDVEVPDA